jgi:hypothetical protein
VRHLLALSAPLSCTLHSARLSHCFLQVAHFFIVQDTPPTAYTFRSSIFGGPLILQLRLTDYNATQLAFIKSQVEEFKVGERE